MANLRTTHPILPSHLCKRIKLCSISNYSNDTGLSLYKNNYMKLIYIKSTMEPKNYSTIRSILKREQGEKIAPYIFKINDTQTLEAYLRKERITYEIYQEERKIINVGKRKQNESVQSALDIVNLLYSKSYDIVKLENFLFHYI